MKYLSKVVILKCGSHSGETDLEYWEIRRELDGKIPKEHEIAYSNLYNFGFNYCWDFKDQKTAFEKVRIAISEKCPGLNPRAMDAIVGSVVYGAFK